MREHSNQQIGHYRLIRVLGQGAFAEVYLGQHIHLNTLAAVKLLHTQLSHYATEQFRHEAQTIANLMHPHIVRVLDFGVENTMPFLIMDYAPNGTLRQRHPHGTCLPLPTVVNYITQVASALQYAHDEHLIHRDVKPENLLLGRQQEVLLGDFGTALTFHNTFSEDAAGVAGTASYMAPEQFNAHPRPASDQYALGVIVYEWLCGQRPFEGTLTQLAWKHTMEPPPSLLEKIPTLQPAIEQVIMRALAKDYRLRYPSVAEFASAFIEACHPLLPATSQSHGTEPSLSPVYLSSLPVQQTVKSMPPAQGSSSAFTTHPPPSTDTDSPTRILPRPHITRRRLIVAGLTGIVVAGSGATWYVLQLLHQSTMDSAALKKAGATILTYRAHKMPVYAVDWSPNGKSIASASQDKTIHVWNATNGSLERQYTKQEGSENTVAWSPNGQYIASGSSDMTVHVWNALTGETLTEYTGHQDTVRAVAWSPNGQYIASGGNDKSVQVWEALGGKLINTYMQHKDQIWSLDWSPNGQYIVSGSIDKTAHIWRSTLPAASQQPLFVYSQHTGEVKAVVWSHNGQYIASVSNDRSVRVWEAMSANHTTLFTYREHGDVVNAVAWSHDDAYVASGSGDYTVHILDAHMGTRKLKYEKHTLAIHSLQWSHDDDYIVSASDDTTVQIWRTRDAPT